MLKSSKVNLSQKPTPDMTPTDTLILGDLNANALKLIYTLQAEGFIQDLGDDHYAALVSAYTQIYVHPEDHELNRKSTFQFYEKVEQLNLVAKPTKIIMLGDDMGDRGARDDLVMAVYKKMAAGGLNFEIIYSNHMHALVSLTEKIQSLTPAQQCTQGYRNLPVNISNERLINSTRQLGEAIRSGIVSQDQFIQDYETVVRPRLKALSYHFDHSSETLCLFSHAPVGLDTIKQMAEHLQLECRSLSIKKRVTNIIDQINQRFEAYAKTNKLHELYRSLRVQTAFYFSIWNRTKEPDRPNKLKDPINLCFIHGHTYVNELNEIQHAISLNNCLGTGGVNDPEGYHGIYAVCTHKAPTPAPKIEPETGESSSHRRRLGK